MTSLFWFGSHGSSLRVTFVPGVAGAYMITLWVWRTGRPLPAGRVGVPFFFVALAVQFLHFAEENAMCFASKFPHMYGGDAYDATTFVTFNMISYAVFTMAAIGLWFAGIRKLLLPVLFFCVYGAFGNACAHLWWMIRSGQYFPGLYTSLAYWIVGPFLIHLFLGRRRLTAGFTFLYLGVAVTLLTVFEAAPV